MPHTNASQPSIFACVDCRAALDHFDTCAACGRVYAQDQAGVALAFPTVDQQYQVTLPANFADPSRIPAAAVFAAPLRAGQAASGVYHLDIAHREIFESLPKGAIVLETGCGGGQLRAWVAGLGLRYFGTDVATTRVHDWLQKFGGADVLCDAHRLPFRDNSVDVVYAAAVYEHLAFPQLAASEVARVLKPGGYFLGSASFLEPWHDESYYHMSPNGSYQMLAGAELVPKHIWPERAWPGFRAILKMGNMATRAVAAVGWLMNGFYVLPSWAKIAVKNRRWPTDADMYETRAKVVGAIAWIAVKE
jgi:SAM-dependent methyltransferase